VAQIYFGERCRPDAGNAEACELVWGAAHCLPTLHNLAAKRLDIVIAADSCYDDQVSLGGTPRSCWMQHLEQHLTSS